MIKNLIMGFIAAHFNIPLIVACCIAVLLCLAILVLKGRVAFWRFLKDWRTWIAVAVVAAAVWFWPHAQEQQALVQTLNRETTTATVDTKAVVTVVNAAKKIRQAQSGRMHNVILHAKSGDAVDSLMDEIAREQNDPDPIESSAGH